MVRQVTVPREAQSYSILFPALPPSLSERILVDQAVAWTVRDEHVFAKCDVDSSVGQIYQLETASIALAEGLIAGRQRELAVLTDADVENTFASVLWEHGESQEAEDHLLRSLEHYHQADAPKEWRSNNLSMGGKAVWPLRHGEHGGKTGNSCFFSASLCLRGNSCLS